MTRPITSHALAAGVAALSCLTGGMAGAQPMQPLAPHRAVYEFKLGQSRGTNAVAQLSGRMVYEFTGSVCDGWSQSMRFVVRTTLEDGTAHVSDQRSTSWEDHAGTTYRFTSSQFRDEARGDQTAGTATRGGPGEDVRVDLTHPEKRTTAVTGRVSFPVQHSIRMLEAARKGQAIFTADFYDGSEGGEKTYVVTAQIGRPVGRGFNQKLPRAGQADKLDGLAAWPVALSYFEQGSHKRDAVPVYEMAFVYYENGVSRRLMIDNGEYSMKGELSDLVMLDLVPCAPGAPGAPKRK